MFEISGRVLLPGGCFAEARRWLFEEKACSLASAKHPPAQTINNSFTDNYLDKQRNLLTKVKSFSAGFYISPDSIFMYNNKAGIVIRLGRTCSDHSLLIDCHYSRVIDSQELI